MNVYDVYLFLFGRVFFNNIVKHANCVFLLVPSLVFETFFNQRNVNRSARVWYSDFVETPDVAIQSGREKFTYKPWSSEVTCGHRFSVVS